MLHEREMTYSKKPVFLTEALLWVVGIGLLAIMDPTGKHLFSFCPFSWLFDNLCPGCGLGHAVAYLFRGDFLASWEAHPLAVPAVAILLWRCGQLIRWHFKMNYI